MRRVPQEAFFSTERIFRTPEGPLWYRISLPYRKRPSLKSGWQLPQKGLSTLGQGQGEGAAGDKFRVSGMQEMVKGARADKVR